MQDQDTELGKISQRVCGPARVRLRRDGPIWQSVAQYLRLDWVIRARFQMSGCIAAKAANVRVGSMLLKKSQTARRRPIVDRSSATSCSHASSPAACQGTGVTANCLHP